MTLGTRLLDPVLLRRREQLAAALAPSIEAPVRALFHAAGARADAAERLIDAHAASALVLYREAALLFAAAAVAARTSAPPPSGPRAADVLESFRGLDSLDAPAGFRARAEALLADVAEPDRDLISADRLEPARAAVLAEGARAVVRWLATLVETRTVGELRLLRRVRVGLLSVVPATLLVLLVVAWRVPTNVALHKPVTLSGNHPQSISPPSGLTDGITSGAYGAHTAVSEDPWVQVDLERRYVVDKVKVYNRGDTPPTFDAGLPMRLQCSEDGRAFVDIETRHASFSQADPWIARLHGRTCRYVRIHGARGAYVALSEVEVFGRRR